MECVNLITTRKTLIDVSTPILKYPVLLPASTVIEVIVRIVANVSSKTGVISIVSVASVAGYNDNVILFV